MSATPIEGVENHRRANLADIVKNRTAILADEIKEGGGDPSELEATSDAGDSDPRKPADVTDEAWAAMSDEDKTNAIASAEVETTETTEPEGETDEQRAAREAEEAAAKPKHKIKVDGEEREVDQDAVIEAGIRALQKESAADKRLEEATKARDEAERLRVAVEQTLAKTQPAPAKTAQQDVLIAKDEMRDIVKKIQYGSEDEAAEALEQYGSKMAKLGQSSALTQNELNNILDLREAQSFVKTNYADVLGDENLKELFVSKVNRKLATGDSRPYQEICKETGDELRQWKAPAAANPTQTGGSRAAALERKTRTVVITSASTRQPAPSQPKVPTQTELIAQERARRGQA